MATKASFGQVIAAAAAALVTAAAIGGALASAHGTAYAVAARDYAATWRAHQAELVECAGRASGATRRAPPEGPAGTRSRSSPAAA